MYQPFAFNKTEVATLAPAPAPSGITLPSGAVIVYDFTTASCWPGSGRLVYDLSGNGFTGSMTGSIGSGSAGALNFLSAASTIQVGNGVSAFYSAMDLRKQLFVGFQYQTGSVSRNTSFASTWDTLGVGNFGYCFFLGMGNPTSRTRSSIQIYTAAGGSPAGFSSGDPSTTVSFATGSTYNTIGMMANITSGSYTLFNNNTAISTATGVDTSKWFRWAATGLDPGKGIRIGNRISGENFLGRMSKFVVYNRALSPDELNTIQAWMTGSAPVSESTLKLWLDSGNTTSYPGYGTTWYDLSGNNNHVTQSGTITFDSSSQSMVFNNNAANYFSSSTAANLAVSASGALSDMSMEMWLQLSTSAESTGNRYYCGFLVGNWSTAGTAAFSFTDNGFGNGLNAQMGSNSDVNTWIPTPGQTDNYTKTNSKGVWRQVVFTRSGSVGTFYVDGLQDRQNSNYSGATVSAATANQLYIGKLNYGEPFFGNIAIAKYWVGKTLSAAEVSASFQATKNRFGR